MFKKMNSFLQDYYKPLSTLFNILVLACMWYFTLVVFPEQQLMPNMTKELAEAAITLMETEGSKHLLAFVVLFFTAVASSVCLLSATLQSWFEPNPFYQEVFAVGRKEKWLL